MLLNNAEFRMQLAAFTISPKKGLVNRPCFGASYTSIPEHKLCALKEQKSANAISNETTISSEVRGQNTCELLSVVSFFKQRQNEDLL